MLALLLVGGSVGMSNFGASIAIGRSGVDQTVRVRIALPFGFFESAVPVIGLLLGRELSQTLGDPSEPRWRRPTCRPGLYAVIDASRTTNQPAPAIADSSFSRLIIFAALLSIDNLIVGFALALVEFEPINSK